MHDPACVGCVCSAVDIKYLKIFPKHILASTKNICKCAVANSDIADA